LKAQKQGCRDEARDLISQSTGMPSPSLTPDPRENNAHPYPPPLPQHFLSCASTHHLPSLPFPVWLATLTPSQPPSTLRAPYPVPNWLRAAHSVKPARDPNSEHNEVERDAPCGDQGRTLSATEQDAPGSAGDGRVCALDSPPACGQRLSRIHVTAMRNATHMHDTVRESTSVQGPHG
jgi:hypothetical protein